MKPKGIIFNFLNNSRQTFCTCIHFGYRQCSFTKPRGPFPTVPPNSTRAGHHTGFAAAVGFPRVPVSPTMALAARRISSSVVGGWRALRLANERQPAVGARCLSLPRPEATAAAAAANLFTRGNLISGRGISSTCEFASCVLCVLPVFGGETRISSDCC